MKRHRTSTGRPRAGRPASPLSLLLKRVVIWEWDADGDRIVASLTLRDVYGVSAIERVSRGMSLVHPDDLDGHQLRVLRAVERGRGYRSRFRIVRPDTNAVVTIEERAEAMPRRASSPPVLIGVALDTTFGRSAPSSHARSLQALEQFCDDLLARYATHLRAGQRDAEATRPGHWIDHASRALARVRRLRVGTHRDIPDALASARARLLATA